MRKVRMGRCRGPWRAATVGGTLAALLLGATGCEKEEAPAPTPSAPTPTAVTVMDVAGYHVLVRQFGPPDGPPVVLIHGFQRTGWSFGPLLPALLGRYHLVVPDLPGHGETYPIAPGPDGTESAPPFARLADAVVAVAEGLGLDRFAIVGHSLGGVVGARIALEHPGRVKGLALLESTPTYQWAKADWCGPECADQQAFEEDAMAVNRTVHGTALYNVLWDEYTRIDETAVFKRADLPILWVMNTDRKRDRAYFLDHAAAVDPGAPDRVQLVTVKDRGHFVHWTATRRVVEALLPFLEGTEHAAPAGPTAD